MVRRSAAHLARLGAFRLAESVLLRGATRHARRPDLPRAVSLRGVKPAASPKRTGLGEGYLVCVNATKLALDISERSLMNGSMVERSNRATVVIAARLQAVLMAETAACIAFFVHGIRPADTSGPHHVVAPAVVALLLISLAIWSVVRRPTAVSRFLARLFFLAHTVLVATVFLRPLGDHFRQGLLNAGVAVAEHIFLPPDVLVPQTPLFSATFGAAALFGLTAAFELFRLQRSSKLEREGVAVDTARSSRRSLRSTSTSKGSAGPARLMGLASSMLLDAPFKSLGTLIGVVVSVFLMAQQTSLLAGILGRVTSLVNGSGADIWIASVSTESTDATESIPSSYVGVAAGTLGAAWAAPIVQGISRVTRPDGVREFVKVLGVEAPRYAGLPHTLAPGTTPNSLRASGRLFLNWNDRPTFGQAVPGDRIEIGGQEGVVGGFFKGMDPHSPYYYIYANIDDARAFTQFPLDRVTFVAVGAEPGVELAGLRDRLQARMPNALVKTRAELSAMEERYFLVRTPVGLVFGMGATIAALIGAAIVAVTMYSTAVDRARDFGTLKAIGATSRDLLHLLLAQALMFSAIGYLLGVGLFLGIRSQVPQLPLVVQPHLLALVGCAAVASCVLACLAAIRRVLALDPAIVFKA
jgi:putative ABC transport system permease protein